jgi:hypothetical protein
MNALIINFFLAALFLVIIIFLLVITVDYFRRNKLEKSLSAQLNKIASFNELKIDPMEFVGDRAIGIDQDRKALVFF